MKARKVPSEMLPIRARYPPRASTPTCPSAVRACRPGLILAVSRTARIRFANSLRAPSRSRPSSRSSCPKPFTTRTPVTSSSTISATSAADCWAAQVAGNSTVLVALVTTTTAGTTNSAITVSSGERMSMITSDTTNSTTCPADNGTMASSDCTICRSVEARETTWPVRNLS